MFARRNGCALLVLSVLLAGPAAALDPQRAITQYTTDVLGTAQGLPQNSVQAMVQTQDGYLWFGTQEGLARYDGVRFTIFDKHSTPALRHNSVHSLLETRSGDLWIGTFVGGATRLSKGTWSSLTRAHGLSGDQVSDILEDADGSLWFATSGGLDHVVDGRVQRSYTRANGLRNGQVLSLELDTAGALWIGTNGAGIARLSDGEFQWFDRRDGLAGDQVREIRRMRNGDLWFGSYGGGASRLRAGVWTHYGSDDGLASNQVSEIREDRDGNIWFATGGGLSRLAGDRIASLTTASGLASDLNITLYEDREGSLWVGSNGGGVTRFRDAKVLNFTTREGLSAGSARVVMQARDGAIWAGTDQGLNVLRDGLVSRIVDPVLDGRVFALAQSGDAAIWVGTHGSGLFRIEGPVITTLGVAQGLSNNVVRAILPTRDGALLVGTDIGLNRIVDGRVQTWRRSDGMSADQVMALLEGRDGSLWIGTNGGGLNRMQKASGQSPGPHTAVFEGITSRQGLGSDVVFALYEAPDGAIWAGTDGGGLCRVRDTAVRCITSEHGLYDDLVVQILDDRDGKLWMSSNRGVFSVPFAELDAVADGRADRVVSTRYGAADGMASPECHGGSQPSGARMRDGRLWFPTLAGLAVFDPAKMSGNPLPPPVRIEAFVVDGKTIPLDATIALAPDHRELEIHYTALSFVNPDAVAFKYRLEGFSADWVDAGARRTAYFTNLPPGEFAFQVIASNSDGIWNNAGASLTFSRRAQWIDTGAFRVLLVLATIGVVALGFRLVTLRHRARQRELQRLVDERTQELAQSNAELARLTRTDVLTGVANRRGADAALTLEWQRALESSRPLGALMIDLDSFKAYNDHYGHVLGDECLRAVAGLLAQTGHGPRDVLARIGGEEFLVILPEADLPTAKRIGEELRERVEAAALPHVRAASGNVVTVSIGAASIHPRPGQISAELISAADSALYRAKNAGRNRVVADLS